LVKESFDHPEKYFYFVFHRGKYEDALDLTQQAFSINSHEPITNFFLGNLLALTKNNHTAAQDYYRRTLTIDPTHIYARRQLRLSYCYIMHATWELMDCSEKKENCDEKSIQTESMKYNSMFSEKNYKQYDTTITLANSVSDRNTQCMLSRVLIFE
jgi:tetratricopeptide (TPR) repeat protein